MAIRNLEWENHNSLRNYPFREGVSLLSANGVFQLPLDAVLDLNAFLPKSGDERFYLSAIEIQEDLAMVFKISGTETGTQVGTITVPSDFTAADSYDLVGLGLGSTGKMVVGPGLSTVQQWGIGEVGFSAENAEIEAAAVLALDVSVVTSVGIENSENVLVGDVVLKLGRAVEGSVDLGDNSVVLNAIKRIEDCSDERLGCPIQSINGITPDEYGNVILTAEGIFTLRQGATGDVPAPGLSVATIIGSDRRQQCPTQFDPLLRGVDGGVGAAGPGGAGGINTQCLGGVCCNCEVCDTCEACDCNQLQMAIGIGGNPGGPGAGPPPGPGGGPADEGLAATVYGTGFILPNGDPNVLCMIWCKDDGTVLQSEVTNLQPGSFDTTVPAGLTTPPSADNKYKVRLKTPIGYTNPFEFCVNAAGGPSPVKIEACDVIGSWVAFPPANLALETVNQFEGAGAYIIQNIPPGGPPGAIGNNTGLTPYGPVPWDFSGFNFIQMFMAKEFDPGAPPFAADFVEITLQDNTFSTWNLQLPVPPPARYPAPHAIGPADFQPVQFSLAAPPIDLMNIIAMTVQFQDFNSFIPLTAWIDCMELIP